MTRNGYGGMITREQFCFFETRTIARLICEEKTEKDIMEEVVRDNLFQYPTERTIKSVAKACFQRMQGLNSEELVHIVAYGPLEEAKQICLYAMMKQYPLVRDFMVKLVGEKYRLFDMSFGALDLNIFFTNLQNSNEEVAGWSDNTIQRIKQILRKILVENEYLDDLKSDHLNPVFLESRLEAAIRENGDLSTLPAFNCLY